MEGDDTLQDITMTDEDIIREAPINIYDDDLEDENSLKRLEACCSWLTETHTRISDRIKDLKIHVIVYVCLFGLCNALVYANKYTIATSIPHIKETFSISYSSLALMVALNCFSSTLFSFVVANYFKSKFSVGFMALSQLLCAIGSFGSCASSNFSEFILAQLIFSLGEGCFVTLATPYIRQIAQEDRIHTFTSVIYSCGACGVSLGYFFGGIFSENANWRLIFGLYFLVFLVLFFVLTFVPQNPRYMGFKRCKLVDPGSEAIGHSLDGDLLLSELAHEKTTYIQAVRTSYTYIKKQLVPLAQNDIFKLILVSDVLRVSAVNAIGFWLPVYMYSIYMISMLSVSLFLAITCAVVGGCGTMVIGYVFEKHYESVNSRVKATPGFINTRPSLQNNQTLSNWTKYLRSCLAFEYVIGFLVVAVIDTFVLLITHSYYTFCILAIVQVFCVFCIQTPLNNLILDVVDSDQKEIATSVQFSLSRIISDIVVIPIIGLSKDHVSYMGFVIIVLILLLSSSFQLVFARQRHFHCSKLQLFWWLP